jgi:hypothetical protein
MYNNYSPVFILSTGRSGSMFLASLVNESSNIAAYHEPQPTLQYFSDFAYHNQSEKEVLKKMIDAVRMELVLDAFIRNKIFVESNQCLTFFAPAISDLFRISKFIHIVRHPGDFVRGAVRKGWHRNDSIWESGRVKMEDKKKWNELDQIERLSWVWQATNQFIEDFKNQIQSQRVITFRTEDLFSTLAKVKDLLHFVGAEPISTVRIGKIQKTRVNEFRKAPEEPPNMRKIAHFPDYQNWDREAKTILSRYSRKLANMYGYEL